MLKIINKTGLKLGLIFSVLMVFSFSGVNAVFAVDNKDGSHTVENHFLVVSNANQADPADTANNEINDTMSDILGTILNDILSVITPNEAQAATDIESCKAACSQWNSVKGCCEKWGGPADKECKNIFSCTK